MDRLLRPRSLWIAALAVLIIFSIWLGLNRIYQVDELQNLYMARVLAHHESSSYFTNAGIYMLGPLGWVAGAVWPAAWILWAGRLIFLLVFWLNVFLVAWILEPEFRSRRFWLVFTGACTLAPLWDYGFEIRHDNLLLLGLLLIWVLARSSRLKAVWAYSAMGALGAFLQFVAFKAFLYVGALAVLLVWMPQPRISAPRIRLAAAWLGGAGIACLLARGLYAWAGAWDTYVSGLLLGAVKGAGATRFPPGEALGRLLTQTPLLMAGMSATLVLIFRAKPWHMTRETFWASGGAEVGLSLLALVVFLANPTPFPYNLVLLVPFAYLATVRVLSVHLEGVPIRPGIGVVLGAILGFTHLVPFLQAITRHLAWPNDRQIEVMEAAEALTDPATDRVYDASGLVLTRRSVSYVWYLHSLNMQQYGTAALPRLPAMLSRQPAAVFIPSYRTDWIPEEDRAFIPANYLPLSDDLWVLGTTVEEGKVWTCLHPGRYVLLPDPRSLALPGSVAVDGRPLTGEATRFEKGEHRFSVSSAQKAFLVWVGPNLNQPPRLAPGDHRTLFVNWY